MNAVNRHFYRHVFTPAVRGAYVGPSLRERVIARLDADAVERAYVVARKDRLVA